MKAKRKSGVSLSFNAIVAAAIVLIVLIVLVGIFTGRIAFFQRTASSCAARGGHCSQEGDGCADNEILVRSTDCIGSNDKGVCCVPI